MARRPALRVVAVLVLLAVTFGGTPLRSRAAGTTSVTVQVLSSRPDMVSGGEALVQVGLPASTDPRTVHVRLNGFDVSWAFHQVAGPALLGRLSWLPNGPSVVSVSLSPSGPAVASLTLVNYPVSGPIFSGPHQTPFVCQTVASGLGPALNADCTAWTQYLFYYKSRIDQKLHPLLIPTLVPADVATTTTLNGTTVNYIVRIERGTIDRGIYQIATLYDPTKPWQPWAPQAGWNGRLLYVFGIGCEPGYHQGDANVNDVLYPEWVDDRALGQGFAVVTSTLDNFGNDCNSVLAAETMMMVKAHFIAHYGLPRYTVGWGTSGGAAAQYLIADSFPGLMDGIVPNLSSPDLGHPSGADCLLLTNYFNNANAAAGWTDAQKAAVSGFQSFDSCQLTTRIFGNLVDPTRGCDPSIPSSLIYNPVTNPKGARCTIEDTDVNAMGTDPSTGFARDPYDNTGLQYGLDALNAGEITVDQFLDLNAGIGGYDDNGAFVPSRNVGDPVALSNAYRDDFVLNGGLGLASTAVIDLRMYSDPLGEFHPSFWSFAIRQRLADANGNADNQLIWETATNITLWKQAANDALAAMTQWLDNVTADTSSLSLRDKIVQDKPAGLGDQCYLNPSDPSQITPGTCTQTLPTYADPRIAAGAPLVDNVLKCTLKPIDFSAYAVSFSAAQQARLQAIFPSGVCDFSQPGVGQAPPAGPWPSLGPAH